MPLELLGPRLFALDSPAIALGSIATVMELHVSPIGAASTTHS